MGAIGVASRSAAAHRRAQLRQPDAAVFGSAMRVALSGLHAHRRVESDRSIEPAPARRAAVRALRSGQRHAEGPSVAAEMRRAPIDQRGQGAVEQLRAVVAHADAPVRTRHSVATRGIAHRARSMPNAASAATRVDRGTRATEMDRLGRALPRSAGIPRYRCRTQREVPARTRLCSLDRIAISSRDACGNAALERFSNRLCVAISGMLAAGCGDAERLLDQAAGLRQIARQARPGGRIVSVPTGRAGTRRAVGGGHAHDCRSPKPCPAGFGRSPAARAVAAVPAQNPVRRTSRPEAPCRGAKRDADVAALRPADHLRQRFTCFTTSASSADLREAALSTARASARSVGKVGPATFPILP